ncbi:MAG: hypothetical protein RL701_924, partial [Pseudomonadota bacterium]
VPLFEHPVIAELLRRREAPPEIMAARLRMARVPEGAELIDNSTGGPPGFAIGNVYVMAGIPAVMRAMLVTLQNRLSGGQVVESRSVKVFLPESAIATPFGALQARYPTIEMGSYPFTEEGRYGTQLVLRGSDVALLESVVPELEAMIAAAGGALNH